jgi:hypothetical protein
MQHRLLNVGDGMLNGTGKSVIGTVFADPAAAMQLQPPP